MSCDHCENSSCITEEENNYEYFQHYCGTCFFERFKNAKIFIDKCGKLSISYQTPIIVIGPFDERQEDHIVQVYVLLRDKISKQLLKIIDKENEIVDYKFFYDCEEQCETRGYLSHYNIGIDRKELTDTISRYKSFDKIIRVKNNTIKYITYQELIDM